MLWWEVLIEFKKNSGVKREDQQQQQDLPAGLGERLNQVNDILKYYSDSENNVPILLSKKLFCIVLLY